MTARRSENHFITRIGWLRAAVLGANDGVLSTASVVAGVAAANPAGRQVLLAGIAALVAGAMSMAAGEYVSVSSQADTEAADLAREAQEQQDDPHGEARELAAIYIKRGLSAELAKQVAAQLMAKDALARDELGITEVSTANPVQAAMASAATFTAGGIWPVLTVLFVPPAVLLTATFAVALVVLAALGAAGARAGGARLGTATLRVVFWGVLAMAVTAGVGRLFGTAVG